MTYMHRVNFSSLEVYQLHITQDSQLTYYEENNHEHCTLIHRRMNYRAGGTGPAGPVLAGPLFSDQVIVIFITLSFTR